MRITILCFLFEMFFFANGFAQSTNGNYALTKAIPPSPEAASLGKYGDIPVGYYTGAPNISIPLYTIQSRDLSVPVSLSYNAGGIKVEEAASSVGLGWSLSAGGVITRTVRGLPDDKGFGFIDGNHLVSTTLAGLNVSPVTQQTKDRVSSFATGEFDGEPDIYYFNFCGHSGKFVMDENGFCKTIPLSKMKIQFVKSSYDIESFLITTPEGVKYAFGSPYGSYDAKERNTNHSTCNTTYETINTGWYLKTIINPLNTTAITFNYNPSIYSVPTLRQNMAYQFDHAEGAGGSGGSPPPETYCTSSNLFHSVRLVSVDFNNGKIIFTSDTTSRIDGMSMVKKIQVKGTGMYRKEFRFFYGYLGDPQTSGRLLLDSLQEVVSDSVTGNILLGPINNYRFEYNSTLLPDRLSYAQDIWGYYNGHTENTTLVKKEQWRNPYSGYYTLLPGSSRQVDEYYAQAGILKKIIYPTGGSTSFAYESNHQGNMITDITRKINMTCALDDPYFSVISTLGAVPVNSFGTGLHDPADPYSTFIDGVIMAVGVNGNDSISMGAINNGQHTFNLTPGNYHLIVVNPKHQTTPYTMHLEWQNDDTAFVHNNFAGGLRVKQMIDEDPLTGSQSIKNFKYKKVTGDTSRSSGALINFPSFSYLQGYEDISTAPPGANYYFTRQGYSTYPLATTLGSSVGYSDVTVEYGNGAVNGKTEYHFTDPSMIHDLEHNDFPFAPSESYDWRRGLQVKQTDYKISGNNFFKLSEKSSNENIGQFLSGIQGFKAGFLIKPAGTNPTWSDYYNYISKTPFYTPTEWSYSPSDTTRTYDANTGNFLQSVNNYTYDGSSFLPGTITSTASNNEKTITHLAYPKSYDIFVVNATATGINLLSSLNIVTPVIEKYIEKQNADGSNTRVVSGMVNTYKSNIPKSDAVYRLEINSPVTNFAPSVNASTFLTIDSRYQQAVLNDKYDLYGNIIQQSKANDIKISYIWDYKNEYPIAEANNADSANIAATSFEADGKGRWVFSGTPILDATAPTGKFCYSLNNGSITKDGLNAARIFTVSYWLKNGTGTCFVNGTAGIVLANRSGWSLCKATLAGNTSTVIITGTGTIDELRLHPNDALMTTYTHEPLLGIKTQSDANNRISYYEYDAFNRLSIIRDHDNNVLKKICYNYAGQPENCVTATPCTNLTPNWQNTTTALRCQQGSCGNTGYQEQEQKDMNPCSPTYNQTQWVVAGQNTTACPSQTCTPLTSTNISGTAGFTASYYNTATNITYSFAVAATTGVQPLGNVPAGNYNLTISRASGNFYGTYYTGCKFQAITGTTPVVFYNVAVSPSGCKAITLDLAN
jgi:hypothetical protein